MPRKCEKCEKQAYYNFKKQPVRFCQTHKKEGMVSHSNSFCEHDRYKPQCRECRGSAFCEHDRVKTTCRDCRGGGICEHDRQRSLCRDCGGRAFCAHDRLKTTCRECRGSGICEHDRLRTYCRDCGGGGRCKHNKRVCPDCTPLRYLGQLVSSRIRSALKGSKTNRSHEYLGCSTEQYRTYLQERFEEGMSWENHGIGKGKWNIDHTIPLMYIDADGSPPTLEDIATRLHYTNTRPMWALENIAKGNRYVG